MIAGRSSEIAIRRANTEDVQAVSKLIALACEPLEVIRWLVDDSLDRKKIMPAYVQILVEHAIVHGTVHVTDDQVGAAVWLPYPGTRMADHESRLRQACHEWTSRFAALENAIQSAQSAERAYEYLAVLAVHPDWQCWGIGGALLGHRHRQLDRLGLPAHLNAPDQICARFFRSHGYEPVNQTFVPLGCPTRMRPMRRLPRTGATGSQRAWIPVAADVSGEANRF